MLNSFRPFRVIGVLVLTAAVLVGGWTGRTHSAGITGGSHSQPALVDGGGPVLPPPVS
jgi:hypothetical protein